MELHPMRKGGFVLTAMALWAALGASAAASDLSSLSRTSESQSRRASSFDPTGGNTDNIISFGPGETHTMLKAEGPGRINHIWLTLANFPNHYTLLRDLVLLMYWENSDEPSVEVPLGDFFCQGQQLFYPMQSAPVTVGINPRAFNCYWPMPFHRSARIQIKNIGERGIRRIYYNIDYELGPIDESEVLFHALFRREPERAGQPLEGNLTGEANYTILETEGRGQYVGTFMAVDSAPGGWWGEGDEMIFIDGEERPSIIGTGTEDYFGNAWGFTQAFSYPFYGAPFLRKLENEREQTCVYRWHIPDPIRFEESIRVTLETTYAPAIRNDFSTVAFWYQNEPIRNRPPLPPARELHAPVYDLPALESDRKVDGTEFEPMLRKKGIDCRSYTSDHGKGIRNGGWLEVKSRDGFDIEIEVPEEGEYELTYRPVLAAATEPYTVALDGGKPVEVHNDGTPQTELTDYSLGKSEAAGRSLKIRFEVKEAIGIDQFEVRRVE